jgi:uncharacterized protein DUF4330
VRVIDDRGRLFGRLNLIDALVALFVLLLVPLAYGAFLLFRVPAPKIVSLTPSQIFEQQAGPVQIAGEDLRPFMVAKIGTLVADLYVQSPRRAEIKVPPNLPAGVYDITLLDQGQILAVQPGALTVAAPAVHLDVQAVGAFVGLEKEEAGLIGPRSIFQAAGAPVPMAEVVALKAPEPGTSRVKIGANVFATGSLPDVIVPAIIRLRCAVTAGECRVGGIVAAQNTTIVLPWTTPASAPGAAQPGQVRFAIDQLFPAAMRAQFPTVAAVRVRFVAAPNIFETIKTGDFDLSGVVTDTGRAELTEVGSDRQPVTSQIQMEAVPRVNLMFQQPMVAFSGTVRVPVTFTPSGWSYKDRPVKVGVPFTFETASGAMTGWVLDIDLGRQESRPVQ